DVLSQLVKDACIVPAPASDSDRGDVETVTRGDISFPAKDMAWQDQDSGGCGRGSADEFSSGEGVAGSGRIVRRSEIHCGILRVVPQNVSGRPIVLYGSGADWSFGMEGRSGTFGG